LAKAIEGKLGIKSELIASDGGAFEVLVDGNKIFSKLSTGRFPDHEEILSALDKIKA